jgi:hypothetical protein
LVENNAGSDSESPLESNSYITSSNNPNESSIESQPHSFAAAGNTLEDQNLSKPGNNPDM